MNPDLTGHWNGLEHGWIYSDVVGFTRADFQEGNSQTVQRQQQIRENPVRENATHYSAGYACKGVLRSYLTLGCERTYIAS
jgi:hypothetical protein